MLTSVSKWAVIICLLFLVGCQTKPARPDPAVVDAIKLDLPQLPPLDLSKYKNLNLVIVENSDKTRVIIMTEEEYVLFSGLLRTLGARIYQQEVQLQEYRKFYESD